MGTAKDSERTKARIIETAGQLFAEKGFKAVTVRDIAAGADTQISALNYHFRSKDALYREVVIAACSADVVTEKDQVALRKLAPETALRLLISEMQKVYRKADAKSWQSKLLARESHDPSPVFQEVGRTYYRPQADFMAELVGMVVGKSGEDMHVRLAVVAMTSMFDVVFEYGELVEAMAPGLTEYLAKGKRLSDWLYDLVVLTAGKSESRA